MRMERNKKVYLVLGSSCSGKSTYVRSNSDSGDLIFDFDNIHKAISNQEKKYELYNAGYGSSFSVKQIVEMIIEESGKNLKIKHDLTKPSINTKLALLSDKAEKEIGWKANISIKEGIKNRLPIT